MSPSNPAFPAQRARKLRREMTDAERRLWWLLRSRQMEDYKFRRQHSVGRFFLDFACVECRLAVEADGGQHADNAYDEHRTTWLESEGWRVLRFWNNDILQNTEGVMAIVLGALRERKAQIL
jgi:very-short-patch-repair endonuclease